MFSKLEKDNVSYWERDFGEEKAHFLKACTLIWFIFQNPQKGKECKSHCPPFPAVQFLWLGSNLMCIMLCYCISNAPPSFSYRWHCRNDMCTILHFTFLSLNIISWRTAYVLISLQFRCCMPKLSSLGKGTRHIVGIQHMLLPVSSRFQNKQANTAAPVCWN